MRELKKIDVMSAGKVSAILMLLFGAIVVAVMLVGAILVLVYSVAVGNYTVLAGYLGAFGMVLLFAVMYAVVGFVSGVIYAAIYNFIARKWGGLKIELK